MTLDSTCQEPFFSTVLTIFRVLFYRDAYPGIWIIDTQIRNFLEGRDLGR